MPRFDANLTARDEMRESGNCSREKYVSRYRPTTIFPNEKTRGRQKTLHIQLVIAKLLHHTMTRGAAWVSEFAEEDEEGKEEEWRKAGLGKKEKRGFTYLHLEVIRRLAWLGAVYA